jgi:hypothetical protein
VAIEHTALCGPAAAADASHMLLLSGGWDNDLALAANVAFRWTSSGV